MIAGLGNPGAEYERTRHNIGFVVIDAFARAIGAEWQRSPKWEAVWAKADDLLLVKPSTYMNHSGFPLLAVANFYKIAPAQMLVVVDDTALPVGRLRLRLDGSSGGHNGLDSIFMQFGTNAVPRLRIGIGAPPPGASVDYVLGRFFEEEQPMIANAVDRAVDALKWAIDKGFVSAMNTFNKNPET